MATFDDDCYYVKDVIIIEDEQRNEDLLKVLSSLLNSKVLRWFYETTFPTLHVQRDELASLPLPQFIFDISVQATIVEFVDNILSIKKKCPQTDTSELENKLDFLIYKLYGLSYDEVLIVDPGTSITREEYYNN